MKYVPIAGTHGWRDAWCMDETSDFAVMMANEGFSKITMNGRPFRWSTALDGLIGSDNDWEAAGDALWYFLDRVPLEDRNIIAHSHGGNVALMAASYGMAIHTLTTVGTPHRVEIDTARAAHNIVFWQHIYDVKRDLIQFLGQVGPGELSLERRFLVANCVNYGIGGISHSKVLRDKNYLHYWRDHGWLANIRGCGQVVGA